MDCHHPWAITYVNLGFGGPNTTVFNISLVNGFNQTGNGTFCLPKIQIPKDLDIKDGTNASIQVVQLSVMGSSLYNVSAEDGTANMNADSGTSVRTSRLNPVYSC